MKRKTNQRRKNRRNRGRGLPRPTVVSNLMYYGTLNAGSRIKFVYLTEGDGANDAYRVHSIKAELVSEKPTHCQLLIIGDGGDNDISATSKLVQTGTSTRKISVFNPKGEGYRVDVTSPAAAGYLTNIGANAVTYTCAVRVSKQVNFDTSALRMEIATPF